MTFATHIFPKRFTVWNFPPESIWFKLVLFCWHFLFVVLAWQERVGRGHSDAHHYWGLDFDIASKEWFDFFSYGTDFVVWLNYPFIQLGIPFLGGFLLYGLIGYVAVWQFLKWSFQLLNGINFKGKTILFLILFLWPNLHYWTAVLGKEPLIFWSLVQVFGVLSFQKKHTSISFVMACLLLIIIRPHVAILLLGAVGVSFLLFGKAALLTKLKWSTFGLTIVVVLGYMVLQLSHIRRLDWDRIIRFNRGSVLSFERSNSYVPMEEYSFFYKLFSFYFRPLPSEVNTLKGWIVGMENLLFLFLLIFFGYLFFRFWREIQKKTVPLWCSSALFFGLFSGSIYVFRYANFGIFMRTKMMYAPFVVVAILWLGIKLFSSKTRENQET